MNARDLIEGRGLRQVDQGQFLDILGAPSPDGYHPTSWSANIDDPEAPRVLHSMSEFWVSDEVPPSLVAKGYSGKLWVEYTKGAGGGLDAPTTAQETSSRYSSTEALYLNKPSSMNAKNLIDSAVDETFHAGSSKGSGSSKMGSSAGSSSDGSKKKNLPPWLRKKGGSSKSESEASGTSAHVVAGSAAGSSHTEGSMVAEEPTSKNVNLKSTHSKGGDGKVPSAIKMAKASMPTPIAKEYTTSSNESVKNATKLVDRMLAE